MRIFDYVNVNGISCYAPQKLAATTVFPKKKASCGESLKLENGRKKIL